jgi:hypothetical protein
MKLKSFCTTKEMVSKLKRIPTEWEKSLCQIYIRQRTDNQKIQEAQNLNAPKIKDSMKKWANELNRAFSMEESKWLKNT